MKSNHKLFLIYSETDKKLAESIINKLTADGFLFDNNSCNVNNISVYEGSSYISEDSAIILIPNEPITDSDWLSSLNSLQNNIRLIPVGSLPDVDYEELKKAAPKIEEINIIPIDSHCVNNIEESLNLPRNFWLKVNELKVSAGLWEASNKSDMFLLTKCSEVGKYRKTIIPKISGNNSSIFNYVRASGKHAKSILFNKIKRIGIIAALTVFCAFIVVFVTTQLPFIKRASYSGKILQTTTSDTLAPLSTVKTVESITNPFNPDSVKKEAYKDLVDYMSVCWPNSVIFGSDYALNDACFCDDSRFILTARGDGSVVTWDTYTGEITEEEKLSDVPINTVDISENSDMISAIDAEGFLFVKENGKCVKSAEAYDIPFNNSIHMDSLNNIVAVISNEKIWVFKYENETISEIYEKSYDYVYCAEINGKTVKAIISADENLYEVEITDNSEKSSVMIPIIPSETCTIALKNGNALIADNNGQIVIWKDNKPEEIITTKLNLNTPLYIQWLNENIIIYNDRNMGTHLYDISKNIDLGGILDIIAPCKQIRCYNNTVMVEAYNSSYYTIDVSEMLPQELPEDLNIIKRYTGTADKSNGMVKELYIQSDYLIGITLSLSDNTEVIIPIYGGNSISDLDYLENTSLSADKNYANYDIAPFTYVGKPTVLGITDNGNTILVGTEDGSFYEMYFFIDGSYIVISKKKAPSGSPIKEIIETDSGYYILDAAGSYWYSMSGDYMVDSDSSDVISAVKNKLHMALNEAEIKEYVSPELLDALEVKYSETK